MSVVKLNCYIAIFETILAMQKISSGSIKWVIYKMCL